MTNTQASYFRCITCISFFLLALALSGCDKFSEKTPLEHIDKALEFRNQGNLRGSVIELKAALQQNPDLMLARQLLGEATLELGDSAAAEKEFTRALELGAGREVILPSLAEALLKQGKYQQVLDQVDASTIRDAATHANLLAYRGDALLAMSKPNEARVQYEEALAVHAESALAKVGLAQLAFSKRDFDNALQLIQEAITSSPQEARAYSLQGDVYAAKGDNEKAEVSYGKAIELRRFNQKDRANRALLRIQLKKYDEAGKDIEILKKDAPHYFLTLYAEGLLLFNQNRYAEAQSKLEESLKIHSGYPLTLYYLGVVNLMQNHQEQAEENFGRFLTMVPGSAMASQMMAMIKFQKKDFHAAKKYIAPVVDTIPNDAFSLRLLADIESALGNREQSLVYLKKLVNLNPKSAQTQTDLGFSLLGSGQVDEAMEALRSAVQLDSNQVQADIAMALNYIRNKQYEQANAVINKLKEKMPNSAESLDLEGLIFLTKGEVENAKRSFGNALEIAPDDLNAANTLAHLAQQEKNVDKAAQLYQQILKYHPKFVPALIALAEIQAVQGRFQETESYLKQAVEAAPRNLEPILYLARLYIRFGQAAKALALLEKVNIEQGKNPDFLAALAEAQLEVDDHVKALATTKSLVKISPKSPLAYFLMARAYAENDDAKSMRISLETSLKLDAKFLRSRLAMVRLLTQEKKVEEAKKYLAALQSEYPENPEVLGLQGWFAMQQREPAEAANAYKTAVEKFPSSQFVVELSHAQWAAGQNDLAVATLGQWIGQYPKDISVRFALSRLYSTLKQPGKAKEQLKAILELKPNNVPALNALAWVLRGENPTEAQETAEKAMSLAPKSPMVIDTLAVILLERGENERALRLMEQAYSTSQKNPTVRYHLARAYQQNDRISDAKKVLSELLRDSPHFEERKEAEQMLSQLNSGS